MNEEPKDLEIAGDLAPQRPLGQSDSFLSLVERAARDPSVDVGKMERLLDMAEKIHARKAESEYDQAMNAAQAEMRPVAQDSENPQTRSRYASYGAMDGALRPIYTQHGFSLSFGTKASVIDRVTVTCRVSHRAGHTERVEIDMPADGKGARGNDVMTKTHATGSAVSYGMRYLLKMIFNVSIGEYDDDGNAAGGPKSGSGVSRPAPSVKTPPRPNVTPAKATHRATPKAKPDPLAAFQERCKARLVEKALGDKQLLPYWQRYAVERGWILPNEGIEAILGNVTPVFVLDPNQDEKGNGYSVKLQFTAFENDIQTAAHIPAPTAAQDEQDNEVEIAEHKHGFGIVKDEEVCPNCEGNNVVLSKDFDGILYCQACAWQYDTDSGDYYEEHPWMKAICPIPPKGTKKADYEPQTLGQIARLDSKRFYGLVMNNSEEKARAGRDWNGKHYDGSKEDIAFGKACDLARDHMEQSKQQDTGTGEDADPETDYPN